MMFLTPPRPKRSTGCPLKAARSPHPAWLSLYAVLACVLLFTTACKRSQPAQTQKPADTQKAPTDTSPSKAEDDKSALDREAFGLPLPPDARHVLRAQAYITASSNMRLHEIEAFYKSRLVDYEYIYPAKDESQPNRKPRELRIIGLRAYMPQIEVHHTGGKYGTAKLNFTPALKPAAPENQPAAPSEHDAQNRRREKGMPVLDRTPQGELLAPGARWGEPYTPPKGSPLHTNRNKDNFGQPYGEWKMP